VEESQVEEISDRVTRMDIDGTPRSGMILEAAGRAAELAVAGGLGTDEATVEDGGQAVAGASGVAASVGCATFCKAIVKDTTAPLLPRASRSRKRLIVATRTSLRQAVRPSPVPVSQRAQRKLMRELQFIDTPAAPPDSTATEYIDLYGQDLPDQAVDTIRAAARLGNKKLAKVLAALAKEADAADMEVQWMITAADREVVASVIKCVLVWCQRQPVLDRSS